MLKPNHAFEQFRRRIQASLFQPWKGTIYRVTTLKYAGARTTLQGEGSYRNGGRWNAIGSFRAVYGSTEDVVALAESKANAEYVNLPYPFREPRLIVAVEVELARVIDLTADKTLEILGVSEKELRDEDWRKIQEQGFESISRALGRAIFATQGEGLLARSIRAKGGVNVAYFPGNKSRRSKVHLCEAQQLRDLGLE
jgi:RES domain-containing protein